MFKKILVANRGEIACRVIKTCKRLGIATVAVYSDADRRALHVEEADEALYIGPVRASESYLDIERILAAAKQTGAEAIHPGYGFLSENSEFARRCKKAGVVFIGPSPESMDAMALKSAAKTLMDRTGVPVVPGYHGDRQDAKTLTREAADIGFPVMIKAVAGGGGKGMRIVKAAGDFADALAGAQREAVTAFGNKEMLLEKYIEHPRHIEFQIFGDVHGNVVHLFERECSLQRRFQKVVEETPSPFLTAETRNAMADAAVAAARAVDYVGAGTVEFVAGADQSFYFMEMNTRLQVEHPVTEETTGIDLVEWQLRIACGEALPLTQEQIEHRGHAIETRLYAEDPAREFLPAPGRIEALYWPAGAGVRVDTGVEAGNEVGMHYDPMVAKITVSGTNRTQAIARLRRALAHTAVFGLTTNIALLRGISAHPGFAAGDFDTGFIERELDRLLSAPPVHIVHAAAVAARLLADFGAGSPDAWRADAFRLGSASGWRFGLRGADGVGTVYNVRGTPSDFVLACADVEHRAAAVDLGGDAWGIALDGGAPRRLAVRRAGSGVHLVDGEQATMLAWRPAFAPGARQAGGDAHLHSPMPGRIVAVHVTSGTRVAPGSALVTLEGMKMEYTVKAVVAGTVTSLHCREGDRVEAESMLVDIEPAASADV